MKKIILIILATAFLSGCQSLSKCVEYRSTNKVSDSGQKCVEVNKYGTCLKYRDYKTYSKVCVERKCNFGGEYPNCKRNISDGSSSLEYTNGTYKGNWVDGRRNGKGIFYYSNGDRFEGNWVDGKKNGKGTNYLANGDRLEGNYRDGKINGQGTIHYADGERYEGNFVDSKQNGQGTNYLANGDRLEGNYGDGKPHGLQTLWQKNGQKMGEGCWQNGNQVNISRCDNLN